MSKRQKKRNKRYHGEDAATPVPSEPIVHHYSAIDRGRVGQWWFEKKRAIKTTAKVAAIVLAVLWLLYELIRIVT
jgi:hypothetical protein